MAELEFFYDFVSPYSYLASTRVAAEAAKVGGTVRWRPFLLGGVFGASGNKAPIENPAKARYLPADLGRWAKRLGVPFAWPKAFPVLTVLPLRAAFAAQASGQLLPFTHAIYKAYWVDGLDISSPAVVAEAAGRAGLDGARLVAEAPQYKDALKAQTQEAADRGSFGAPTFFVGSGMFIGNDRLDFAVEAMAAAGKG